MPSMAEALSLVCLAGAQELTLLKGMWTKSSPSVLAKLSTDIFQKYADALLRIQAMPRYERDHLDDDWFHFIKGMQLYHKAITYMLLGKAAYDGGKMAFAVAYMNSSLATLKTLQIKPPFDDWPAAIGTLTHEITHLQARYTKENDIIHHERVVGEAQLEMPEGKCLVQPIPFAPPPPTYRTLDGV